MISLHYTSHTEAYNTIYTACNIVEAIYSFTKELMDYSLLALHLFCSNKLKVEMCDAQLSVTNHVCRFMNL